ncbi:glycosyltransferase family 4 protein [Rubrolithibacter danxiaensis]|uniref:glycosyltransferase family 4 protein n=1 Tax=Rubrolithibacter danxiaensis TaxID=3390805 RepID=UPI003BF82448
MNILVLHSSSDLYGASQVLLNVIKSLIEKGDNPIVILSENGPLTEKLTDLGAEVKIIRLGILRRKYLSPRGLLNRINVIRQAQRELKQLISERKIEIVYSHTTAVLVGALVAKQAGIKHIWHVLEITTRPWFFVKVTGFLLNNLSATIIAASNAVKEHWNQFTSRDKIIRIYNGINLRPFEEKSGAIKAELHLHESCILIGMIGRVHYWKGQDYFLRIAGELSRTNPDIYFVMVGDAFPGYEYLYSKLEKIVEEEKIADRVFNLGYRTDIVNILNSLDIFVLPSVLPDPFPTVVLEAMAAAKPVVATKQGGAVEMIEDGVSGVLIPLNDAALSAKKMIEIIKDSEKRLRMGENAYKRVITEFSITAFNNAIVEVFR